MLDQKSSNYNFVIVSFLKSELYYLFFNAPVYNVCNCYRNSVSGLKSLKLTSLPHLFVADIKECDSQSLNDCTKRNAVCEENPEGGYNCVCRSGHQMDDKTGICVGKCVPTV